jgi:CheY-like chemotaxis protein
MASFEEMNILLVDDNPENLYVMTSALEDLECNIFQADSGQEALKTLTHKDFDLVLLDVQMPGMDGFEVAELMKGNNKTKDVAIIFITAISKEIKYIQKGYDVGAENYLFKPIEPDELRSKVETALKYRRFKKLGERKREV